MTRGTVSAIIPVHNGAEFLAEAVASIRAQEPPPDEIIVVDDGSSDGSDQLARDLGDPIEVVVHASNLGVSRARNTGLEVAGGEFIAFLDSDDLWSPDKMGIQLELMAQDTAVDVVIGRTQKMCVARKIDGRSQFENWSEPELALSLGASLIRRRAFDRIGQFDVSLGFTEDWDWFMRAREQATSITLHEDVVHFYRRHGANMTEDIETGNRDTLRMIRMSLERRKRSSTGERGSLPKLRD